MKIKAAVIGMGIGEKHVEAIENYNLSKVLIICEKNKKKLKYLKKKYPKKIVTDNESLIFKNANINLVSIASYDNFHFNQILKCFKNNKNFIVEKPMCLTLPQLKKINQLLKKNKKVKMISNLVLRTNSLFNFFKKNINRKDIFYIEADYLWGRIHKLFQWRSKIFNYSLTLGAGIHMIDLIMWLINEKPLKIYCTGNNISTKNTNFKKKSFIIYLLKFKKNLVVKISVNATAPHDHFHNVKIYQKNKTLVNSFNGKYLIYRSEKSNIIKNIKKNYPDKKNRKKLIRSFIDYLLNKRSKSPISHKEQIDLMSVCFFAEKSLKQNKELKISYLK